MGHTASVLGNEEVLLAGGRLAYQLALENLRIYSLSRTSATGEASESARNLWWISFEVSIRSILIMR